MPKLRNQITKKENRPNLLVISSVLPYPGLSGQQQRVKNSLLALRKSFHITFITFSDSRNIELVSRELKHFVDTPIVLRSLYNSCYAFKIIFKSIALIYSKITGLKTSNFVIKYIEFNKQRIKKIISNKRFDLVLFEYWHATHLCELFEKKGIICVLDLHNIIWQVQKQRFLEKKNTWFTRHTIKQYKKSEELAWLKYDILIGINKNEYNYLKLKTPCRIKKLYVPMGVDLEKWIPNNSTTSGTKIVYYGGMGSQHNQRDALYCYNNILPRIWLDFPKVQFWIVGSNPPSIIRNLAKDDNRVIVTGYVDDIIQTLSKMTIGLCPWTGTYGFRSRIVELMSLEIPVICSEQAVDGMDLNSGEGLYFADDDISFSNNCINLLYNEDLINRQKLLARKQISLKYSIDKSYGYLNKSLFKEVKNYSQ